MEFAWAEYKKGSQVEFFVKSMHRIKLFPQSQGGCVKFNSNEPGGRWWYNEDTRIIFIEFNGCSDSFPDRRHALYYRGEGHYDLIHHDDPIYKHSCNIWSAK